MNRITPVLFQSFVILVCGWLFSVNPVQAGNAEFYLGFNTNYLFETSPEVDEGIEVTGNLTNLAIQMELGVNLYRLSFFAAIGLPRSTLQMTDRPSVPGTSYSSKFYFGGMMELNAGVKILLNPYRSWQQYYITIGGTYAPQNVELLVYNKLVEDTTSTRFGGFVRGEYILSWFRWLYFGLYAGFRYTHSSIVLKNTMRFPTSFSQFGCVIGVQAGLNWGRVP